MESDYIKQLESDNKALRRKLIEMYSTNSRSTMITVEYNQSGRECHQIAEMGDCGYDCPIFLDIKCHAPEGGLDIVKEKIQYCQELIEKYENRQS